MRFDCVLRDDWGTILTLLQADKTVQTQRSNGRRRERGNEVDEITENAEQRKTVLALLKQGQVSRAENLLKWPCFS